MSQQRLPQILVRVLLLVPVLVTDRHRTPEFDSYARKCLISLT